MPATSKNILANSFKGFESLFTQWRMFVKMTFTIIFVLILFHLLTLYLILKYHPDSFFKGFNQNDICIFNTYSIMSIRARAFPVDSKFTVAYTCEGQKVDVQVVGFLSTFRSYYERKLYPIFMNNFTKTIVVTSQIYWIYFILLMFLSKKHKDSTKDSYLRGKVIIDDKVYSNLLREFNSGFKIHINDRIFVPDSFLSKHNFIIGATGSGKSQLASRIIEQLDKNNCKCIIHDFKGDVIPAFYDPSRHYIFNTLDKRHMGLSDSKSSSPKGWTIFNEIETLPNVDSFASSMIPDGQGDPIWYTAPRDLLTAMIYYCIKNNRLKNSDLFEMIETPPDKLRDLFEKTPGCKIGSKHLEEGKLAGQFMSILATYTSSLQYLVGTDGDFSIRKWISDPNSEKRIIFLANQAEVQKTLKKLISTFFDFSIKALCTLPDDPDGRRIHFFLEEFGQLAKMESIIQLLTQGRSKGAASWILIQDMSQIEHIYGRDLSKTIINGCRNKYYFNVADHPTAEFISKEIGTVEYQRTKESKSFGISDLKDSISINDEIVERPIALPSQITSQKNLSFYLQLSDIPQITHTSITYRKFPSKIDAYLPRDIRVLTYGENEGNQNSSSSLPVLSEEEKLRVQKEKAAAALFSELQELPLESDETPVDPSEIPDFTNLKLVPESASISDESAIIGNSAIDYEERVNF